MTFEPFGVSISSKSFVPFVTILIVAPESAQASSLDGVLKIEKELAVVIGGDGVVLLAIQLESIILLTTLSVHEEERL